MTPKETLLKAREQNSGWVEHDGKGMPVDGGTLVDIRFDDGDVNFAVKASELTLDYAGVPDDWWKHEGCEGEHIVAYRLHTPASSSEDQP